jgi:hypothetical protein
MKRQNYLQPKKGIDDLSFHQVEEWFEIFRQFGYLPGFILLYIQTVEISQTILLLDETTNHQSLSLAEDNYSYIIKLITK